MTSAVAIAVTVGSMEPDGPPRLLDPARLGDHVDRLYRAALALCGNRHDAEDLVQDTYARVLAKPRLLRRDDDLGYLLRVLRNTFLNRIRTAQRRPAPVELDPERHPGTRPGDPRDPEAALRISELLAAIGALPGDQRDAVIAIDVVGLSYREAARALQAKEATITTRLHRGRARLAGLLGAADPAPGASYR
ncbi:RNA polymerase sigma factor [Baekduia soli]|uniref:RNA polymerase sigma factor n=1 Tax=Baekduia soli TaxID=496014 RepID=A0A5B8U7Q7_9ACTN|nr:RNA polymerase sigma factor [Baekduia soli]QEC49050.1 RNA polymerase sigma factor [Baekduia soli]